MEDLQKGANNKKNTSSDKMNGISDFKNEWLMMLYELKQYKSDKTKATLLLLLKLLFRFIPNCDNKKLFGMF